jgi:hypothetical protein
MIGVDHGRLLAHPDEVEVELVPHVLLLDHALLLLLLLHAAHIALADHKWRLILGGPLL